MRQQKPSVLRSLFVFNLRARGIIFTGEDGRKWDPLSSKSTASHQSYWRIPITEQGNQMTNSKGHATIPATYSKSLSFLLTRRFPRPIFRCPSASHLLEFLDLPKMGACISAECAVLRQWSLANGFGLFGISGLSLGGHMVSFVSTTECDPIVLNWNLSLSHTLRRSFRQRSLAL